ncbi:hypothetical protein KFL_000260250 [Klebsormidium nitens]|uniref:Uncharacterized protein n=1 Tax=Klebsormidium nitens TaxID=105231 RepID=A0A1Y1HPS5_KLENI|nr:hypothetical protein KFL_000260250 [Klebsormidium nitens]|eukprot:GAQ79209.1 hypothetical protein KFL_000260250 [Klebsormidium nitens]
MADSRDAALACGEDRLVGLEEVVRECPQILRMLTWLEDFARLSAVSKFFHHACKRPELYRTVQMEERIFRRPLLWLAERCSQTRTLKILRSCRCAELIATGKCILGDALADFRKAYWIMSVVQEVSEARAEALETLLKLCGSYLENLTVSYEFPLFPNSQRLEGYFGRGPNYGGQPDRLFRIVSRNCPHLQSLEVPARSKDFADPGRHEAFLRRNSLSRFVMKACPFLVRFEEPVASDVRELSRGCPDLRSIHTPYLSLLRPDSRNYPPGETFTNLKRLVLDMYPGLWDAADPTQSPVFRECFASASVEVLRFECFASDSVEEVVLLIDGVHGILFSEIEVLWLPDMFPTLRRVQIGYHPPSTWDPNYDEYVAEKRDYWQMIQEMISELRREKNFEEICLEIVQPF